MNKPDVTVVVVNYNTAHLLDEMFTSLYRAAQGIGLQVIVVDNASRDDSCEVLSTRFPEVELIRNVSNVGFGRANNQALKRIKGEYVLLLNTDAFMSENALRDSIDYMAAHPECGILGARLLGRDGAPQPSCRFFPSPMNVFLNRTGIGKFFPAVQMVDSGKTDPEQIQECDWVPGCYYLIRRRVLDDVGLFDPRFFLYYEEVDHCKVAKAAGWKVVYLPTVSVVHIGGESAKSDSRLTEKGRQISGLQIESELLFFRKHYGVLGVFAHMVLTAVGGIVLAGKGILKPRNISGGHAGHFGHIMATWRLLQKTRWANQPTR